MSSFVGSCTLKIDGRGGFKAAALTYLGIRARILQDFCAGSRVTSWLSAAALAGDAMLDLSLGKAEPREDVGCCSKASSLAQKQGS